MDYKEKLEAYRKGELSEEEARLVEKDIDKFAALLDYIDEKATPATVAEASDSANFTQTLNKSINKKISRTVVRVLGIIGLFAFLFFCGIFATTASANPVQYALTGIYSTAYISTMFVLLYKSFVKKEKLPAITIILWTVGLTAATFIVSPIIGDAAAFILPAYFGFAGLIQIASEFTGIYFLNEIVPIALIAVTLTLSVVGLILSEKKVAFKPISTKALIAIVGVFCAIGVAITAAGTAIQVNSGAFPENKISSQKLTETIKGEKDIINVSQYIGKDLAYVENALGDGYKINKAISSEREAEYTSKRGYRTFSFGLENGVVTNAGYRNAFRIPDSPSSKSEINRIKEGSLLGMTQGAVLDYLFEKNLLPRSISTFGENKALMECYFPYGEGGYDSVEICFENGICVESFPELEE